ncbi:fibronectin type III domain-containing protein [Amycolatopsis sp. WQ 127309]|uniref:fibronectin type III domain-containing protein n=1 Tax=Amycolatopsis sp. WQ 127309 TaxID=2932773 RepID=UPI001FF31CCD|nr:fibronectin type III domain-containing protein [Amycolatopsis sp. WQ 127309]UOZ05956.1 fibronectin type III domain-containing protein [Amycolatopsis sp. WQ 127309]
MSAKPLVLVVLLAAGCAAAPAPAPPPLTATLTSPTDVVLAWPDDDAGHRVEYANDPAGPWTTLEFLPPHTTSYHHPDLIPETPFYYREQPFTGPVSVETTVGAPTKLSKGGTGPAHLRLVDAGDGTLTVSWTDMSPDEAGFLLEIRRPGEKDFSPVEVTDPDTSVCALSLLPGEQGSSYRVRALFYGPLSPVVHQTTGKER